MCNENSVSSVTSYSVLQQADGVVVAVAAAIVVIIIISSCSSSSSSSFMQGIYSYIPETNNVSRQYSVATIL
jgi:hypothetical protein